MQRIKMILEYDGSAYHGFQRQSNAHTIQAEIESAIYALTGENLSITAAGRTDAGVHAWGQVIAFHTNATIPAERWSLALNSKLPEDIRILSSQAVPADFHPQFWAHKKSYAYLIYRQTEGAAFYRNYALLNTEALNLEEMQEACGLITGKHDFRAFCASGSSVKNWERNVSLCRLSEAGPWLRLDIEADGFLYNMVRIIAGTLLEIGRQRIQVEQLPAILESHERALAGPTVAPQGLYLCSVDYPSF